MTAIWTIRRAQPEDAPAIACLADALSLNEGEPTGGFNAQAILRDCFGETPELLVWVAESGRDLIGFATAHPAYDTAGAQRGYFLADMFVEQDWRRKGIARALMAAVVAAAKQEQRTFVWWTSKQGNDEAQRFYASIGASVDPLVTHWLAADEFVSAGPQPQ